MRVNCIASPRANDILETLENIGAQGAWADLVLAI